MRGELNFQNNLLLLNKQIRYIGYRHLKSEERIEKIIFSSSFDGRFVAIKATNGEYHATSFGDDDFSTIVSDFGEFVCVFLLNPNFSQEEALIGVWAGHSPTSESICESGRIILTKARDVDERTLQPAVFGYDMGTTQYEEGVDDISTIYFIRKYFFNKNDKNSWSNSKLDKIYDEVRQLANTFESTVQEMKGIGSQFSEELRSLKQSISEEGKFQSDEKLNLKFQVAQGDLSAVLERIKQIIAKTESELFNDFLLHFSSNLRIEEKHQLGLVSLSEYSIEKNRINKGVLSIIDQLPDKLGE